MKYILTLLLSIGIANKTHAIEEWWWFGDSLSSGWNSQAEFLDQQGYAQIRNMARGGLRAVDVEIPDWLLCWPDYTRVVLYLGGNDALQDIPDVWFEMKYRDFLQHLSGRQCSTLVILPPALVGTQWEEKLDAKRRIILRLASEYDNTTVIDLPHPSDQTVDGLHQDQWLMWRQAEHLIKELELTK